MDVELEAAIDRAGRDRVFALARMNGWRDLAPPKWVWWQIVRQIEARDQPQNAPGRPRE